MADEANPRRFNRSTLLILSVSAGLAISAYFAVRYLSGRQMRTLLWGLLIAAVVLALLGIEIAVKRRRFRFRLPTLLALMLGIGLVLGVFTSTMRRRMESLAAQRELASLGCLIHIASHPGYRVVQRFQLDARERTNAEQLTVVRDISLIYDYDTWRHPNVTYEFAIDVSQARFDEPSLRALRESLPKAEITE